MDPEMSDCRATYQGDDALARMLQKAGTPLGIAEVRALVEGVNAGSVPDDDADWPRLIVAEPSPALEAQLRALRGMLPEPEPAAKADRGPRVMALRAELAKRRLVGFLIPRADEHQGEYVPPRAMRLAWLTGFTGSAGVAAVLADRAAIFVDGRYTLQVRSQVDGSIFEYRHLVEAPLDAWLAEALKQGEALAYDPWLHTADEVARLAAACERAGARLVPVDRNLVDAVWQDQPPAPLGPAIPHDLAFAGEPAEEKRQRMGEATRQAGAEALVVTQPDSLAWLLNLRGRDVPRTPLPLGFAVLKGDGAVDLYMDRRKLTPAARTHLGNHVRLRAPEELGPGLDELAGRKVLVDPRSAPGWVFQRLDAAKAQVVRGADPCQLAKACKNPVEIAGTRTAHVRDGAAVTKFLSWLATSATKGGLTEIAASDRLESFRKSGERFRDLSFDSISGAGPNGAIVHYKATPDTDRPIRSGELYLIDSGAQYLDGTTDITRTIAIGGTPTAEERDRFTRVLKGHIALALARFPQGTTGSQLDALARLPLWQAGLDYDHGTGHGVGSYLSVHEGPQRISKVPNTQALKPGMIVSNEPGYYKTDGYGIRVENLVTVVAVEVPGAERPMLGFETLTCAPIDLALVEPGLLSNAEIDWLDAYHARVRETLTPLVDADTAKWLAAATQPVLRRAEAAD
jgi:Xaa-Pro aminopeptidase